MLEGCNKINETWKMFGQPHVHHHSRVSNFSDVWNDVCNECCRGIGPIFCTKNKDYTKCNDFQTGHHIPHANLRTLKYFFSARCSVYLKKCMENSIWLIEPILFLLQGSVRILVSGGVSGASGRARGGRSFAWQGQLYLRWRRERLDQTWRWISHSLLAYRWKFPPSENQALHYEQLRSVLLWLLSHSDHPAQRTAFTAQSLKQKSATNMWTAYFERWKKMR